MWKQITEHKSAKNTKEKSLERASSLIILAKDQEVGVNPIRSLEYWGGMVI